ncbi:acyltransferase family protein [Paraburkholderia sp. GAS334]|uniref:acyltransferase family protein n=1 Tax=Paraburkholderia sp. GAS334 TaxID=3035131 RepID=UPI003D1CD28B
MTSMNATHKRFDCLEILRFVLAFMTMTWHYYYFGPMIGAVAGPAAHAFAIRYFSFSVEIFFVISGFIITASAINRRPVDFLIGRVVRLGPCLLVCATLSFVVGLLLGHGPTPLSYVASLFIVPLVWTNGADWSYWSLRLEIVFYAVVFLTMCVASIKKSVIWIALLMTSYDAVSIVAEKLFGNDVFGTALTQYPLERYLSFFSIGMVLYLILVGKKRNFATFSVLLLALAAGAFRCYEDANRIAKLVGDTPVSVLSGVSILAVGVVAFVLLVRGTTNPRVASVFSVLGRISYPLYLIHQNLGYLMIRIINAKAGDAIDWRPFVMAGMVVTAGAIALYVEPVLATYYRRYLSSAASSAGLVWARASGSKRSYGDAD